MEIDLNTTDLGRIVHALELQREWLVTKRSVQGREVFIGQIDNIIAKLREAASREVSTAAGLLPEQTAEDERRAAYEQFHREEL